MAYRLLCFVFLVSACAGPEVVYTDAVLSVIEQPRPRDFNRLRFQEYRADDGRVVLSGGGLGILRFLARTQVLLLADGQQQPVLDRQLTVVLGAGIAPDNPAVLLSFLDALDGDLVRVVTGDGLTNTVKFSAR